MAIHINAAGVIYFGDRQPGDRAATDEEVAAYQSQQARHQAQSAIDDLEVQSGARRWLREFFIVTSEGLAAQQSVTPQALYAGNVAYARLKDIDGQIRNLRKQL